MLICLSHSYISMHTSFSIIICFYIPYYCCFYYYYYYYMLFALVYLYGVFGYLKGAYI